MSPGKKSAGTAPGAVELIEESVHLLRSAPRGVLAVYLAGTAPFVLGFLFFWAYVTWFTPRPPEIAWAACGMVVLFAAMKAAHAEFCSRLLAMRMRTQAPGFSMRRLLHLAAAQMRIQAWGLIALPAAALLTLPLGWVYAYYQNVSVLCENDDVHELASGQAKVWPAQNHVGLLLLSALFLAALVNLGAAFWVLPWIANRLLGIENIFGVSGWGRANTTFIASIVCMAWLLTDPVVKAFYVLRVFYGRARSTGEDLRVELQGQRAVPRMRAAAAVIVLLLAMGAPAPAAVPADPPAAAAVSPGRLDTSIRHVLDGRDFQWRLRPAPDAADLDTDGPVKAFVRKGVAILRKMGDVFESLWRRISALIDKWFPSSEAADHGGGGTSIATTALRILLYIFAAVAVALIAVIGYLIVTRGRADRRVVVGAREAVPAVPDVADERSHAGQLNAEEWLGLARRHLAQGEWRFAWRALYLATLARLAAEGLVSLARSKTNLDYEREVRRRALGRRDIAARFTARRGAYEDVWYGQITPDESKAREWLAEMEGLHPP